MTSPRGVVPLVSFLLCLSASLSSAERSLFISMPSVFHLGEDETVSLMGSGLPGGQVRVTLNLRHPPTGAAYGMTRVLVKNDVPALVRLKVDVTKLGEADVRGRHYVRVTATANKAGVGLPKATDVLVSTAAGHVFVRTDKPIYTPHQKVLIQVFTTDEDTRAEARVVRVEVVNPQDVTVKRIEDETKNGILSSNYQLPVIPYFGNWSVVVKHGLNWEKSERVKIEVKEYELPSYEVTFKDVKDYIVNTTKRISFEINARYSFNHFVQGSASVHFRVIHDDKSTLVDFKRETLTRGIATVILDLATLGDLGPDFRFPGIVGARLQVEAVVLETSSGRRERAVTRQTAFVKSPYVISFKRTPNNFHPGLTFRVEIDLMHANGQPARGVPVLLRMGTSPAVEEESANDGHITHTFDVGRTEIVTVTVRTQDRTLDESHQAVVTKEWTAYNSADQLIIRAITKGKGQVHRNFQFEVVVTNQLLTNRIWYMAVSRGKIVDHDVLSRGAGGMLNTGNLAITSDMVPITRIIAWYKSPGGAVVADSIVVHVERKCHSDVTLEVLNPPKGGWQPGASATLKVTAAMDATVALLAVDKAVYFLNDKDVLTRDKMFDQLEARDLGCGGGAGANTHQVFQNTGLAVISNTNSIRPAKRESESCDVGTRRRRRSIPGTDASLDPTNCCLEGNIHAGNHTQNSSYAAKRMCINTAVGLPYTDACVNSFFKCCSRTALRMYRLSQPQVSSLRSNILEDSMDLDIGNLVLEWTEPTTVRKSFPEFWLFETYTMDSRCMCVDYLIWKKLNPLRRKPSRANMGRNGEKNVKISLPDSITTWVIQGVAMSPTEGMCVAQPSNMTATKQLFIRLDLPYSVIKGEQVEVKATVFNMAVEDRLAYVAMGYTKDVCSTAVEGSRTKVKKVTIPSEDSVTVTWPIVPLKVGDFPIRVSVVTFGPSETVEKVITVVHGGEERRMSVSGRLDPESVLRPHVAQDTRTVNGTVVKDCPITETWNPTDKTHVVDFDLRLPAEAILGSAKAIIGVMGEAMAPVVKEVASGTEKWIRLPRGCGEQTMMRLGPTVFAGRYLKQTGQMTPELERNTHDFISKGIQKMYNYQKINGGFTVWPRHKAGVWLTAFVVKTLSQASKFAQDEDASEAICRATSWIYQNHQNAQGAFVDPVGILHHVDLKGELHNRGADTLSAAILIGLRESSCKSQALETAIARGRVYLEGIYPHLVATYDVAMVAYALALTDSDHTAAANTKLKTLSRYNIERNERYWPKDPRQAAPEGSEWHRRPASALDVETAGYALLTQLAQDDIVYSHAIVTWLLAQRTAGVGFRSTQDTVIAIQALTEYSLKTQRSDLSIDAGVTSTNAGIYFHPKLRHNNRLIRESSDVSSALGGRLILEAKGTGLGVYQLDVVYNTNEPDADACVFDLTVESEPGYIAPDIQPRSQADPYPNFANSIIIEVCARYLKPGGKTNMAIMDVGMHTGYTADTESLKKLVEDKFVEYYETTSRSVIFYLEKITSNKRVCVKFVAWKGAKVFNTKPVAVHVYDYYDPEDVSCQKFYHPDGLSPHLNTKCQGELCSCLASCPDCHGFEPKDVLPPNYAELLDRACNKYDYVYVITVTHIRSGLESTTITANVEKNAKKGADSLLYDGMERMFILDGSCACFRGNVFDSGQRYLVMGKDAAQAVDQNQNPVYNYMVDGFTFVSPMFKRMKDQPDKDRLVRQQRRFVRRLAANGCPT